MHDDGDHVDTRRDLISQHEPGPGGARQVVARQACGAAGGAQADIVGASA
jgi:hypothetical protein